MLELQLDQASLKGTATVKSFLEFSTVKLQH